MTCGTALLASNAWSACCPVRPGKNLGIFKGSHRSHWSDAHLLPVGLSRRTAVRCACISNERGHAAGLQAGKRSRLLCSPKGSTPRCCDELASEVLTLQASASASGLIKRHPSSSRQRCMEPQTQDAAQHSGSAVAIPGISTAGPVAHNGVHDLCPWSWVRAQEHTHTHSGFEQGASAVQSSRCKPTACSYALPQ